MKFKYNIQWYVLVLREDITIYRYDIAFVACCVTDLASTNRSECVTVYVAGMQQA